MVTKSKEQHEGEGEGLLRAQQGQSKTEWTQSWREEWQDDAELAESDLDDAGDREVTRVSVRGARDAGVKRVQRVWKRVEQRIHPEVKVWGKRGVAWVVGHPRLVIVILGTVLILLFQLVTLLLRPHPPFPWRDQCRSSFPTHYALSPASHLTGNHSSPPQHQPPLISSHDHLQLIPLSPAHPAWPYTGSEIPSYRSAAETTPVSLLIGVFTIATARQRRSTIRATYGSHSHSRRGGTEGVKVVFVLGRLEDNDVIIRTQLEEEQASHGDLVFLPIHENMNEGKTHAFFTWAAESASVPACHYPSHPNTSSAVCSGHKRPAYVMKADDDSFIMLGELERRLRVIPRTLAYWGLLMFGEYRQRQSDREYMTGEGYVLSMDLVRYIATDPYVLAHTIGDEDQRVGDWIRAHPEADRVIWVTERCWMYDHPRAQGYALSHGFLFPDVVSSIRTSTERDAGQVPRYLPDSLTRSWSTVSSWNSPYLSPAPNMNRQERLEAMIEGSEMSMLHHHNHQFMHSPRHGTIWPPEVREDSFAEGEEWFTQSGGPSGNPSRREDMARRIRAAWKRRPTRAERMQRRDEVGSTVLVHEVKREEWWAETAGVLLGDVS